MTIFKQLLILISIFLFGEFIANTLPSPLPGNVIGFILLIILLKSRVLKENSVDKVGDFLLSNLAILFIPGGVGIIKVLPLLSGNIIKILIIVIATTILTVITTGLTIRLLERIKK